MEILKELNIVYNKEYKFKDCINPKTNKQLRFDFYLPKYNICIEFDGVQHYNENSIFFSQNPLDSFDNRKYRDNIKTQYCRNNHIKLIRIPYYDYDKLNKNYLLKLLSV